MANEGTLHRYTSRLVAFEHARPSSSSNPTPHTILWVGGLGDGLLTVKYPSTLAKSLPPAWSLAEVLLSSSYKGWGVSSLSRDASELAQCVSYFRTLRPGAKIVLMGHSTGCQDIMEYLVGRGAEQRPGIDGVVLQGGLSDREAFSDAMAKEGKREALDEVVRKAEEMVAQGRGKEIMPREGNVAAELLGGPMSAYRTKSLLARGGDDDYFSSDLSDEVLAGTFGRIPKEMPVLLLFGGEDPYVPAFVDKVQLLKRWANAIRVGGGIVDEENGGVIPGATHNLNGDKQEVVGDLVKRVLAFVKTIESEQTSSNSRL